MESKITGVMMVQPTSAMKFKASSQWKAFLLATCILTICFSVPLFHLARFAWQNELYSYILLVPFISWYLARSKKTGTTADSEPLRGAGVVCMGAGAMMLAWYFEARFSGAMRHYEDGLAMLALAFFFFFIGLGLALLGRETMRSMAFPFGVMFFIVPMPAFVRDGIEKFLQYGSAYAAHGLFTLSTTPFVRDDLTFILPGMPQGISVAPECSGIHSTLILFITSLLAGYLFLHSPWNRAILTLAVVPLGLLRNGFRVFTLGQLCVHYGPQMLDTPIHHKGGPIFFALSLIPFFALLAFLYKRERRSANPVKN
ncbi:MAG TPA: VPDSG-CTERM-specific exosortase XrtC [Verrucomicrobiae bacterium]|nr:VPDSG-CTERM-specific exosortase XrtC [Verrucomicrobiae bacterium]